MERRGRALDRAAQAFDTPPVRHRSAADHLLDALLPALYLRGISAGDFQEVLTVLLGRDAPGLSPAVIARPKGEWEEEYRHWQARNLSARRYDYGQRFFERIRTITAYLVFADWEALMEPLITS